MFTAVHFFTVNSLINIFDSGETNTNAISNNLSYLDDLIHPNIR